MKSLILSVILLAAPAFAGELDNVNPKAPDGLIVRELSDGSREVFKATLTQPIKDADAAQSAITAFTATDNKITTIRTPGELDRTSSDESWFYYYVGPRYGAYNYGYAYTPYYSYYSNYAYTNYSYYGANWYGTYAYYYPSYTWTAPTGLYYFYYRF